MHLPPAAATGSGQAFAGHIPTTAFVSINNLDPQLSLIDTGATLSVIDRTIAEELDLFPLKGTAIQVNGVGSDCSLGFATLNFSIQGRRDGEPILIKSSADFHVLVGFKPGICLGLDVISSCGIAIDVRAGRVSVGDASFPVYDTCGKAMSAKHVGRALVTKASTVIAPLCHALVPVTHHLLTNVQYAINSSLWVTEDRSGQVAVPSAVLDAETSAIWVSNFGEASLELPSDTKLATAVPLAPDDLAVAAGSFRLEHRPQPPPDEEASPIDPDQLSPNPEIWTASIREPRNSEPRISEPSASRLSSEPQTRKSMPQAETRSHKTRRCTHSFSSPTIFARRNQSNRPRSHSVNNHWPRTPAAHSADGARSSQAEPRHETAQPLDFGQDDLAHPPSTSELNTSLVDGIFHVGKDPSGQPHPTIVTVLRNNLEAFLLDGRPGHVEGAALQIDLSDAAGLRPEAPRRVSPDKRRVIDDTLDQLLKWDVIEPSSSPVSYPVLLVKQGQKWRFCVDYRGLNASTMADRYPLPRIDDVFQALRGNTYFSGLDAIRRYHQIDIEAADRWKTAFVCHRGLFQYKRVPFGLKNAPAFFQRFMDQLLGHMRWTEALVYLDDVVVFSPSLDQHARSLDCLLKAARKVGLKFSPSKCHFALQSLDLLGRRVSTQGISVLLDRAKAVRQLLPPTTLQELYHVIGLFNYYQDFIPHYARIAAPLTALLRGHKYKKANDGRWHLVNSDGARTTASATKIEWGKEHNKALNELKAALVAPPTLAYPDFSRPFTLYVDASRQAFAAALHQRLPLASSTLAMLAAKPTKDTAQAQRDDPTLKNVIAALEAGQPRAGYKLQDGILVYVGPLRTVRRLCVPFAELPTAFKRAHDESGHFGFAKTALQLESIHHPRLSAALQAYIDNCPTCLRTKLGRRLGELSLDRALEADRPFHTISADLLLGLPPCCGFDAALIVMDTFSKMVLTAPCNCRVTSDELFQLLTDLVLRRGWRPKVIITDSDKRFVGTTGQDFAAKLGV